MFLEIQNLLNPDEIARLNTLAQDVKFVEGRLSNPANDTKHNLQADLSDPRYAESSQIVGTALMRSREFRDFAFPRRFAPPLLSRYEPGMKYGVHADSAYMAIAGGALRSDLSCTVFISDPMTYEGGELAVHLGARPSLFKGSPGSAIVYPSTTLHEVAPVRSGVRLVSLTFIESLIPDQTKRNLLFELNEVGALEGLNMQWQSRVRFEAVRQNLLRMWSS
ncbi:MAG TPA: Fe2+-dependent dioxygenase [Rhizomicrobium sp.]|jgi:PKHD-type hydroxylase|nr:Fe2+-dependent dioxygenase [Rhizomicrobium sp.]